MRRRKRTVDIICIVLSVVLLLVLGTLLYLDNKQQQKESEELRIQSALDEEQRKQDAIDSRVFVCSDDDASASYDGESVLANASSIIETASYNDYNTTEVSFSCTVDLDSNSYYLLRLIAVSETDCAKVTVNINSGKVTATYPVYAQKAEINIPVTGITSLDSIKLTADDDSKKIYLTDIEVVDSGSEDANSLRAGIYLCDASETVISEEESVGEASKAMVVCGNYLYSVCEGTLTVYDITDTEIVPIATLDGLGDVVDIMSVNNGAGLAISSRANGVYFIDISDPLNPIIASHYDTLELATGISSYGKYVFICSRYFGIEILYVSDLSNPVFVTQIYSELKEYYDCSFYDGYLYVSAWGQQEIEVYDLSNYSSPRLVKSFDVDGNPGGIVAQDGYLYIATGYHSQDDTSEVSSTGYGMGNGLEIYDLSDPSSPQWLSSNKIDGRYRYSGNDFWKVKVSGNIAVLASTYNGVYIFDISNPSAPQRLDHVTVRIDQDSANYKKYEGTNYVFSWDTEEYAQTAVVSLAIADNAIFLGDPDIGLFRYELDGISAEGNSSDSSVEINVSEEDTAIKVSGYSASIYSCDGAIYAATSSDGNIFVGTSTGIVVLDENLSELFFQSTTEAVKDLVVSEDGKWLYAAESENGVVVYSVNDAELTEVGRCSLDDYTFSTTSLVLSSDGSTLVVQAGFTRMALVDISDKYNPVIESYPTGGTMYYRNLAANTTTGGHIIGYDRSTYYVFSSLDSVYTLTNSFSGERDGIAVVGDNVIAITSKGYVYFDPLTVTEDELNSLEVHTVYDVTLHGKVNVNDDGTVMVVSDCITGTVTLVNIEDLDNPKLIYQFTTDGNPDIASFYDDCILIPLRHGGLLKLEVQ